MQAMEEKSHDTFLFNPQNLNYCCMCRKILIFNCLAVSERFELSLNASVTSWWN